MEKNSLIIRRGDRHIASEHTIKALDELVVQKGGILVVMTREKHIKINVPRQKIMGTIEFQLRDEEKTI